MNAHTVLWQDILRAFIQSTIGIYLIWLLIRFTVLRIRKWREKQKFVKGLAIQLFITVGATTLIVAGLFFESMYVGEKEKSVKEIIYFLKNLEVNAILFAMFVNGVYEVLFLFEKLTKAKVEKEKYQKSVVLSRLENVKNQINPHFLFNTFNALSDLIEVNPSKASHLILELSDVYRYVLLVRDKNWVSLQKEYEISKSFIEILKVRYEDNIQFECNIEKQYNNWNIPPLSVQMLIENAIKHNEISTEKRLKLNIYTENEHLVVSNNLQRRKNLNNSNGIGLNNIKMRYQYLLKKEVIIEEKDNSFTVKLPLIKIISDESLIEGVYWGADK